MPELGDRRLAELASGLLPSLLSVPLPCRQPAAADPRVWQGPAQRTAWESCHLYKLCVSYLCKWLCAQGPWHCSLRSGFLPARLEECDRIFILAPPPLLFPSCCPPPHSCPWDPTSCQRQVAADVGLVKRVTRGLFVLDSYFFSFLFLSLSLCVVQVGFTQTFTTSWAGARWSSRLRFSAQPLEAEAVFTTFCG